MDRWIALDATAAGIFFAGTIHDVAQVVGAGAMISLEADDTAVVVKLLRVALLVPAIRTFSLIYRGEHATLAARPPLLPDFLVAFVTVNSFGLIPHRVGDALSQASRWCRVAAIADLGVKTSFQQLAALRSRDRVLGCAEPGWHRSSSSPRMRKQVAMVAEPASSEAVSQDLRT